MYCRINCMLYYPLPRSHLPYYIIYIVSVHAFKSLCWKAHCNDIWVNICSSSQGNVQSAGNQEGATTKAPSVRTKAFKGKDCLKEFAITAQLQECRHE